MSTITLEQRATEVRVAGSAEILAGIWLIIAPFALNYAANGGSTVNDIIVGIVVLVLAGFEVSGENFRMSVPNWVNFVLGVWLVLAPFVLGFASGSRAMWNDIILGLVIGILALFGALVTPGEDLVE